MKVDFLVGNNHYASTAYFAKKFSQALKKQGYSVRLFWIGDEQFYHAFYSISQDPPDLICSFSDVTLSNVSLGALWQIPFLSILVDPAIYFLHQCANPKTYVSCVDLGDYNWIRQLQCDRAYFLPHAIEDEGWVNPRSHRTIPVAFFGSCIDYNQVASSWESVYSKQVHALLMQAASRVLSPEPTSIFQALVDSEIKEDKLPLYHYEVDRYIRGRDRIELVQALEGFELHIWGSGPWKQFVPWATIHKPLPFEETLAQMQHVKIVLSSSPRFKQGQHERILYGFQKGCAIVTGKNPYITKTYGEVLPTYAHGEWSSVRMVVAELLNYEASRYSKIEKGQAIVKQGHTWDARVNIIHSLFEKIRERV